MKKITLLVIGIFLTLLGYSQSFYKIVRFSKCEYRNEKWATIETRTPENEFVIVNKTEITVANYKFKIYGDYEKKEYEEHTTYSWNCINGEGRKCYFMMKIFKPQVSSHILYAIVYDTGVMYEYETEE